MEILGRNVRLRTTMRADRAALVAIRRTPEVHARWHGDDLEAEFDQALADEETVRLTIETLANEIVGLIQFYEELEPEYRHASIDIYVSPNHHRQGIAFDAITSLVDHLFGERGHHRLTIDPAASNVPAIECYTKVGFQPVGIMRQYERQADGTWANGLLMELLQSEWVSPA